MDKMPLDGKLAEEYQLVKTLLDMKVLSVDVCPKEECGGKCMLTHRRRSANEAYHVTSRCKKCRSFNSTSQVYFEVVPDRTAKTLLAIIYEHVLPGSIVYSDKWSAYSKISKLHESNIEHKTVNHSIHFLDPDSQACTNKIESHLVSNQREKMTASQQSRSHKEFQRDGSTF